MTTNQPDTPAFDSVLNWATEWPLTREAMRQIARQHMNAAATEVETKADGSWVTAVDHAVQAAVQAWLAERFPAIGFLGEEMTEDEQNAAWARCLARRSWPRVTE